MIFVHLVLHKQNGWKFVYEYCNAVAKTILTAVQVQVRITYINA